MWVWCTHIEAIKEVLTQAMNKYFHFNNNVMLLKIFVPLSYQTIRPRDQRLNNVLIIVEVLIILYKAYAGMLLITLKFLIITTPRYHNILCPGSSLSKFFDAINSIPTQALAAPF